MLTTLDTYWLPAGLLGVIALWAMLDPLRKRGTCPVSFCKNRSKRS